MCNLAAPHVTFLPLLWVICFVEGICKIQGTFECISTIQLWMTPKRDFTVFFPMLHIIILGSMQVSDLLATYLMHYYHWSYMHWFMAGVMMVDLLIITLCTRHFRIVKKFPLFRHRLAGSLVVGAALAGSGLFLLLRRVLRLVEQSCYSRAGSDDCVHAGGVCRADASCAPSFPRTEDVDIQASFPHLAAHYAGRNVPCRRTFAGRSVSTRA